MTPTKWVWLICGILYVAFFSWYTSFGGPLTDEEIEAYMTKLAERTPRPSPERLASLRRFMENDTGDDFVMLNVIDMYETPLQIEGVGPSESSGEVMARYMAYMWPALLARASHPVMTGSAAHTVMDIMNAPGMESWTSGSLMRYRSRRDMLDITTNPEFGGSHDFKVASLAKTIAFPLDPWFQFGDLRLLAALFLGLIGCALSWWFAKVPAKGEPH
jgi:hypothetical protein